MVKNGVNRPDRDYDQPFWPVRSTRSGDSKLEEQGVSRSDEQFTSASAAGVALVAPQRGSATTHCRASDKE